jgi:hypothetical protein
LLLSFEVEAARLDPLVAFPFASEEEEEVYEEELR